MDGNGRWAVSRGHARFFGHIRGAQKVKEIVKIASQSGVKALTLFAFSTENWERPETELQVLWKLLHRYLKKEVEELNRNNVRLRFIGQKNRLSPELLALMEKSSLALSKNTGLQLNLAISYGARAEILQAASRFAIECVEKGRNPRELTEVDFKKLLWTSELGELSDVDLVIRTSGEKRTSNFLLWQAAYAEYCFVDASWPDFSEALWNQALREFSARERRFGKVDVSSLNQTL